MNLKDALSHKMLRVVPLQENGWAEPYRDFEPIDYKTLLGQEVALINFYGKFVYVRNKELADETLTSSTGVSLAYVDVAPAVLKTIPNIKVNKSKFIKITLNEETLSKEMAPLSRVRSLFEEKYFADLAIKVINGEVLTDVDAISLLVDPRLLNVFGYEDVVKLTRDGVVYEIANQSTTRGKLYLQEIRDGVTAPRALELFSKPEVDVLKKAVRLL